MKARILLASVLIALAACTTTGMRRPAAPAMDYAQYAGPELDDVFYFRLDSWEAVSRNELIVWTGLRDAYLLKVWEPCPELDYAQVIGFTSRSNRLTRFDKLLAGRDICPISSIRKLDTARIKADRLKARQP